MKKGYINRNYILGNGKPYRFTLEVLRVHLGIPTNEIKVGNNTGKVLKTIIHTYSKAPYFNEIYPIIEEILLNNEKNLARYIGYSIEKNTSYFNMDIELIYESTLNIDYSQFNDNFIPNLSILDVMMFNDKDTIKDMLHRYKLI